MINYNDKWTRRKERCLLSSSPIPPGWECSGYPITVPLHFHPFLNFSCGRDNLMPPHTEIPPWVIQFFTRLHLYQPCYPACLFVLPQCSYHSSGHATRTTGPTSFGSLRHRSRFRTPNGFGCLEDAQI